MRRTIYRAGLLGSAVAAAVALTSVVMAADEAARVAFPDGYKSYKNYLSLDRTGDNHNQIIRLFANDTAARGPGGDGRFANGSILVGEIYKAKLDENGKPVVSILGRRIRDKLAAVAVMEKREGWGEAFSKDLRNDDWDFAVFSPDGKRLVKKDIDACRSCHAPLSDKDHVFSIEHLR